MIIQLASIFHNHLGIRIYFLKKRWFNYLVVLFSFIVFLGFCLKFLFPYILNETSETLNYPITLLSVLVNLIVCVFYYIVHLFILNYLKQKEIKQLNAITEIEYLKQQLNPHFLLNALNNLYSVSLSNPEKISSKIIELSDLLKYQIETSKKNYISLNEEKIFINQYLLYAQWKSKNISIKNEEIGEIKNYKITPMIFLPLLENALKYCNFEKNPVINLKWIFEKDAFTFTISNNYIDNYKEHFSTKSGLKNLRKRLQLFHPSSKFEITKSKNVYTTSITLWNLDILA